MKKKSFKSLILMTIILAMAVIIFGSQDAKAGNYGTLYFSDPAVNPIELKADRLYIWGAEDRSGFDRLYLKTSNTDLSVIHMYYATLLSAIHNGTVVKVLFYKDSGQIYSVYPRIY